VFGGLQEVLNIEKCTADIHKELPNSCVFIMKSDGEEKGEKNFYFFLVFISCFEKKSIRSCVIKRCYATWKYIFENNKLCTRHRNINRLDVEGVFQLC
jgi:hypothetical protein